MKGLNSWRMQVARRSTPKRWGPKPQSYSAVVRETVGGRLVVDLPDTVWHTLNLKPGTRIWFAPWDDGFALATRPRGPRGSKRHSSRILKVHMPLKLLVRHPKKVRYPHRQ